MINKSIKLLFILAVLLVFTKPSAASAATAYFSTDSEMVSVGDTAVVEIRLDTEGKQINVVEGEVKIDQASNIEIREISVAGSVLTMWSRKPSLSSDQKIVSFTGGIPGGFSQNDALIFKIYYKPVKIGRVSFSAVNFKSFVNDGKGTLARQSNRSLLVSLKSKGDDEQKDALNKLFSSDNMPPEFLAATPGREQSLFDNKYFVFINASDYQSGVDHYEVKEGERDFIRSGNIYVLQDQKMKSVLTINAFDKAGNIRTLVIKPNFFDKYGLLIIGSAMVVTIIVLLIIYLVKKKRIKLIK